MDIHKNFLTLSVICFLMARSILWNTENVSMPAINTDRMGRWIEAVAKMHNRILGDIAYIFCDDEMIIDVNRKFLQHDYYTDIITFDYSKGKLISGDMFISLETVASNAMDIGADSDTELHRVIIHGILHLCGINDKGPGEREIMEQHENQALEMLEHI